jgi:hypothetical protein
VRIYCTPGSGKTTCCADRDLIDGDDLLYACLEKRFPKLVSKADFAQSILRCFERNRGAAEECYTQYMQVLQNCKDWQIILFGTRRFMWLADFCILEWDWTVLEHRGRAGAKMMLVKEIESFNRFKMKSKPYFYLKGNPLTEHTLKRYINEYNTIQKEQKDIIGSDN